MQSRTKTAWCCSSRAREAIGLQAEILGSLIGGLAFAASLIDAAVAVFRPDGRSLHDLIFRTRVVLDTRTENEPA